MTTIVVPFYGYLNSRIKRLWNITEFAKRRSLFFTSYDEIGANLIALDAPKRKLLYFKKGSNTSCCLIVDLGNLEKCSIKKEYYSINAGELKSKKLHRFLKGIFLNLGFKNPSRVVTLPFYIAETDLQEDVAQAEDRAKKWEAIVSKFKPARLREIA